MFRIDVLWHIIKHADFPDNPINPDWDPATGEMNRVSIITHQQRDRQIDFADQHPLFPIRAKGIGDGAHIGPSTSS
jgi:hypothetical protein